ncbi:MAG: hypothetical protein WD059_07090 [Balneolaceae bacterium]
MVTISVGLAVGLVVLGIVAMLGAGIKSFTQNKQDYTKIVMMAIPFVVFAITYGVLGDVAKAAVFTAVFMMGAMVLTIMLTGLRGTFKF